MQGKQEEYYRCQRCRERLFDQVLHGEKCTSFFIPAPQWLEVGEENEVKLHCPKCKTKIGEVIWSGKKCSCL